MQRLAQGGAPGKPVNLCHPVSCLCGRPESCLQQVACLLPPHFWPVPSPIRRGVLTSSWSQEWPLAKQRKEEPQSGTCPVLMQCPRPRVGSTAFRCG